MRSRVLAVIILFLIIVVPVGIYWYFVSATISAVHFIGVPEGVNFHIQMNGKLNYRFLPIADKVIALEKDCNGDCIISGIPPVHYIVNIVAPGYASIDFDMDIYRGNKTERKLSFVSQYAEEKVAQISGQPLEALYQNGISENGKKVWNLGSDGQKDYVIRQMDGTISFGYNENSNFIELFPLPGDSFDTAYFDKTLSFLFVTKSAESIIFPLAQSGNISYRFPYTDTIFTVQLTDNGPIVTSESGIYEVQQGEFFKNTRFSSYIDITPNIRLGYISRHDSDKLKLQNFSENTSVVLLLDRSNGKSVVLQKQKDIQGFVFFHNSPAYIDSNGNIYSIKNIPDSLGL